MNQNLYEPNMCYNSVSFDFDQFQPPQFPVIHQPPQEKCIQQMEDLKQQYLDEMKSLINSEYHDEIKIDELKGNFIRMSIEINKKEKLQQLEWVANLSTYPSKRLNSFCYDDDDDDEYYTVVITPDFPITDSLIMENEHLDTIPETESDEFIKSSVENLVSIPTDCEPEEDIYFFERLLYDNSSPQPLEEFNFEKSDAIIESFSQSPIPAKDSDPFMEEIDLFLASDGSIPPGIDSAYSDSEGDNLFSRKIASR
nr:hypothetical protein [Tanacetum cinerariifolium]